MQISVTERNLWKTCRRRWFYGYNQQLTTTATNPAFWLGTGVHYALEKYYRGKRDEDTLLAAWYAYVANNHKVGNSWDELVELGTKIVKNYWIYDYYFNQEWEIIAVEQEIKVPIINPATGVADSPNDILLGIIDLVIKIKGHYHVVDHKTAASYNPNIGLELDDQLTGYADLFYREYGILPSSVMYNTILKQHRNRPELLKNGTYSTNKQQKSTYELYVDTLTKSGITDFAPYNETLDVLKEKPAFYTQSSYRNINELRNFEEQLYLEHTEMCKCSNDMKYAYTSASTWNCSRCIFLPLCKAELSDSGLDLAMTCYKSRDVKEVLDYE